ncbi:M23 family metallopeptidase [Clostridium sp. CM028]|uniref:M23 family metallopeptidase n=1 Tax=Clostridium sp. CM028 TaxID=2851575 RepID=UPI001C6DEAE2|nr:M23 family metallopeptidase [Clostridium sp. CM028]MBW9147914.1 M23 family metallopeptidase [Clostridium sp. CM028]WLC61348.1 M23 family metallopeptidase [Clostridium sp. CM028]
METGKSNRILNYIMASVLFVLWGSIFLIHGIAGAVAWPLSMLFFAPIGVILVFINMILLIICLVRKKNIIQKVIALLLSIFLAFPILMLFDVLQLKYPANIDKVKPSITVRWPLKERTIVGWGGDTIETNSPHVRWSAERWAYDLVMEPENIGSKNLRDYGIYDKEVVAPISGTIIAAYDKENDILPNTEKFLSMEGNHVYIKIDKTGTFLLLNHLKKGSVLVKAGEHVSDGDIIGSVGNSGSTSEPHLHIHHQRQDPTKTIYSIFAEGLPLYFKTIDGKPMPEKGSIITPKKFASECS